MELRDRNGSSTPAHSALCDIEDCQYGLTSTGVESDGGNYVLNGQFTLKGVTKPVSLDLDF